MVRKDRNMRAIVIIMMVLLYIPLVSLNAQEGDKEQSKKESKIEKLFKMSLEELMNVKVSTAGKTPERIGDIPASVVLITREDIETYGFRTLAEILENIPGLYAINDYSEGGANFGVRGFWSGQPNDNMIILVNGVHHVSDFLSNYPLDKIAIPVEAIDRIEVIRGPMSVLYGSGAFYGVINIKTNEPIYEPVNIVSGSIGSEKTKELFIRIANDEGNFKYFFNASLNDTNGLDKPLIDMVGSPSVLANYGVPLDSRTGGKLENSVRYFNFSGTYKDFSVNMSYNEGKKEIYFAFPSVSSGSYDRMDVAHLSFDYHKELSDVVTMEGKFTYSHIRDSYKYDFLSEDFYGIQELETNAWELELNAFIFPSPGLNVTAGLYYRSIFNARNMFDLPSFGVPDLENNLTTLAEGDEIVTRALFTQADFEFSKNLKLVAGLRLEQSPKYGLEKFQIVDNGSPYKLNGVYDKDQVEIIPRVALLYYLNDRNIFKFLYGRAINRPSFAQNAQNSLTPLQPELEPESIQTLEINYIGAFSPRLSLNVSIFRNTLNNLITRVVEFDENNNYTSWSANAGKMITNGMELTLNAEPLLNFRVELSGIFQNTEDKRENFKDITVAYSPKILGYFKASYLGHRFTLALTGNYVGRMETFWDETIENENGSFGNRIGDKTDGYFVLSGNIRMNDLFIDGLYLNIRCSNLLNEEIRYPTYTNNSWATRGTLGIGRTFLVTLGYKF
jgi:outer membrane receptor protein involved in Fe transport